jgi:hypothetical protein
MENRIKKSGSLPRKFLEEAIKNETDTARRDSVIANKGNIDLATLEAIAESLKRPAFYLLMSEGQKRVWQERKTVSEMCCLLETQNQLVNALKRENGLLRQRICSNCD